MVDWLYELEGVRRLYDGRLVLDIEQLFIRPGEVLAVVGPSGAGKSTLLRLLNFLEPPDSGRLSFQRQNYSSEQPMPLALRRKVTTVFQRPFLLNRSVEANVRYGLQLRGQKKEAGLVEAALAQVGLQGFEKNKARTLSGGEGQRVALARALVIRPDVLLLDEPTANLDPYHVAIIEKIVRRLNEEEGTTVVLVTHNIFQARRLADRVGFLLNGRLVEIGPVERFFNNPNDSRTAAFVNGEMVY